MLDEILVTLQLGRGITAHTLVVVGGNGGVEHIHREVQYAVLRVVIGQDHLVHGTLGEGLVEVLGRGEMVGVQVALAHGEQVQQHQQADSYRGHLFATQTGEQLGGSLGQEGPQEQSGRCKDKQQGTEGIGPEEGDAVLHQGIYQHILHLGVGGRCKAAEKAGSQPGQEAEAAREAESPAERLPDALGFILAPCQTVQGYETQQRQRHLQHHQRHGHRAELVIQRKDVETQFGERHEMAAHGHQDGQDGYSQQPPFLPALIQAQAQDKQENGDGTHIHRPGREGLGTPVQRQCLGGFLQVFLTRPAQQLDGFALVRIHGAGRGSAVEIRNHQVGQFLPAIAPGSGVIQVQALGVSAVLGQFGPAAHGIGRIFGQRQQLVHVGGDARAAQHQQQGRCHQERLPLLAADGLHQFHHPVSQHHDGQVVGNLLVVGLDLQAQRQAEKDGAKQRLPVRLARAIRIHQRRQHPRHKGDGLHLGVVAYLDDLEIVTAERHGDGPANGQGHAYTHCQEQQESAQQSDK